MTDEPNAEVLEDIPDDMELIELALMTTRNHVEGRGASSSHTELGALGEPIQRLILKEIVETIDALLMNLRLEMEEREDSLEDMGTFEKLIYSSMAEKVLKKQG